MPPRTHSNFPFRRHAYKTNSILFVLIVENTSNFLLFHFFFPPILFSANLFLSWIHSLPDCARVRSIIPSVFAFALLPPCSFNDSRKKKEKEKKLSDIILDTCFLLHSENNNACVSLSLIYSLSIRFTRGRSVCRGRTLSSAVFLSFSPYTQSFIQYLERLSTRLFLRSTRFIYINCMYAQM